MPPSPGWRRTILIRRAGVILHWLYVLVHHPACIHRPANQCVRENPPPRGGVAHCMGKGLHPSSAACRKALGGIMLHERGQAPIQFQETLLAPGSAAVSQCQRIGTSSVGQLLLSSQLGAPPPIYRCMGVLGRMGGIPSDRCLKKSAQHTPLPLFRVS